jgi:biopolymer transport protein TolQ
MALDGEGRMLLLVTATQGDVELWSLVRDSGAMARFVLLVLAVFSVVSWGIIAERFRTFRRAERETDLFLEQFRKGGGLAAIQDATTTLRQSPLAVVFRAGFREISLNPPPAGSAITGEALDALDRMLRKGALVETARLERSLGFLATTAAATPFIGLFGTVWGIMKAFHGIGASGTASLAAYAPGITEALVTTAAGLAAAIPAVIAYNHFLARLRGVDARTDEFIADFIHRVQGRRT